MTKRQKANAGLMDPNPVENAPSALPDIRAYARHLQEELRKLEGDGPQEWQALVDRGLSEAYGRGDNLGLLGMLKVVVSFLDVAGRHDAAVTQIDHAINIARDDVNALPVLIALRGCYLALQGRTDEALFEAESAETTLARATLSETLSATRRHTVAIRLFSLEDVGLEAVDRLVHSSGEGPLDSDSLFLSSYHIPFLFASGL